MAFDRKAYMKEWKRKEYHRKKEKFQARNKKWRDANREHVRKKQQEWRDKNREHWKEYRAEYKSKNPEKFKNYDKQKYQRELKKQDELARRPRPTHCEHCGRPGVVWDHDHSTNEWRSWPCRKCNTVMGLVDDRPEVLRRLADCIERHREEFGNKIQLQACPDD